MKKEELAKLLQVQWSFDPQELDQLLNFRNKPILLKIKSEQKKRK